MWFATLILSAFVKSCLLLSWKQEKPSKTWKT